MVVLLKKDDEGKLQVTPTVVASAVDDDMAVTTPS
jgi:hypothetical protein